MTTDLRDLYQQVILDHQRAPRNFRDMPQADRTTEGHNPLCGDKVTIYLKLEGDIVADVSFQGVGCAICMSCASIMTEQIKGKSVGEIQTVFRSFHTLLTGSRDETDDLDRLGKLRVFSGVREFPIRVKCAMLPWHTFRAAIGGNGKTAEETSLREEHCLEALKTCYDPELPANIVDLGLVYECRLTRLPDGGSEVLVLMTLTSPGCGMSDVIKGEIEEKLADLPGVKRVRVQFVFDPPWDMSRMSEAARLQVGLM